MWDSHPHLATHADIRTSARSSRPHGRPSLRAERSPTDHRRRTGGDPAASVPGLSPAEFSARIHLTSELLRTLSMMAASEPTSWLSMRTHILYHLAWI